jgi:hypothetical protein
MGMASDKGTAATVEVVVRFAGDLHDVARVPAGTTYTVGRTSVVAKAGTELTDGLVTITVCRAAPAKPVPRRRAEIRPYVYGSLSLAAHVALLIAALQLAIPAPTSVPIVEAKPAQQRGAVRIKPFVDHAQSAEPEVASVSALASQETTEPRIERDTPAPEVVTEFTPSEITGGGLADGPKDGDGTSQRFDPSSDPAFDTIKSGDYSTVSTGRAAGDEYAPQARNSNLVVITCDRITCLVVGGEKATRIRRAVEERMTELTGCYKEAAETGGGTVEVDFAVDANGRVKDLEVGKVDTAGLCVAKILRTLPVDELHEG